MCLSYPVTTGFTILRVLMAAALILHRDMSPPGLYRWCDWYFALMYSVP